MSLVAYGGSSEEEDSGDEESTPSCSRVILNSGDSKTSEVSSNIFTSLPKPKPQLYSEEQPLQADVDPQKEIISSFSNITATRVKGVTRIGIPSLKNLNKEIDEDEQQRKKITLSKKKSGLFAILPEPKRLGISGGSVLSKDISFLKKTTSSSTISVQPNIPTFPMEIEPTEFEDDSIEPSDPVGPQIPRDEIDFQEKPKLKPTRQLIPHVVSQTISGKRTAPTKMDEIRAKYLKQEANVKVISRSKTVVQKDSDSSDDEKDFFSFTSKAEELSEADYNTFKLPPPPIEGSKPQTQVAMPKPIEEEHQDTMSIIPEDVMKFVQKGKNKRAKQESVNFIDVRADSLRLESHEMLKTITDTSLVPPRPITGGPGGMTKKKHQITYLAFEAKAREQELQNQWAQNRHTKRLSQNKYGF